MKQHKTSYKYLLTSLLYSVRKESVCDDDKLFSQTVISSWDLSVNVSWIDKLKWGLSDSLLSDFAKSMSFSLISIDGSRFSTVFPSGGTDGVISVVAKDGEEVEVGVIVADAVLLIFSTSPNLESSGFERCTGWKWWTVVDVVVLTGVDEVEEVGDEAGGYEDLAIWAACTGWLGLAAGSGKSGGPQDKWAGDTAPWVSLLARTEWAPVGIDLLVAPNISDAGTQWLMCTPAGQNLEVARSPPDGLIKGVTAFVVNVALGQRWQAWTARCHARSTEHVW